MRKAALLLALAFPALAQQQAPDLLIVNAKLYGAEGDALAIREGRCGGVGTAEQILASAPAKTRTVDAKKHLVVPGFNDAHIHATPDPPERFVLSLNPDPTVDDLQLALGNGTEETPEETWILGTIGPKTLSDARVNAALLDKAAHNRKVLLTEFTGHGIIMSSAAMTALRLGSATDPIGGWFERDSGGRLTGKAFEYADYNVLRKLADLVSDDEAVEQLRAWADGGLRHRVPSAQTMPFLTGLRFDKLLRHNRSEERRVG